MKKFNIVNAIIWLLVSILFSIVNQYITVISTGSGNYNWSSSIKVWLGGLIIGVISAIIFLVLNFFILKKNNVNKLLRVIILIVIILITSTKTVYNFIFG